MMNSPFVTQKLNSIAAFGIIFLFGFIVAVGSTFAGPPAICHPVDIGNANSLPWGNAVFEQKRGDSKSNVIKDTIKILKEHRLKLDHGKIQAFITAPPRLFFIDTPAALAVDYGCEYILEVDEYGNGELEVILGWVALEHDGRQSIVPMNGSCQIRAGIGPGTPYFDDASQSFLSALNELDFTNEGGEALKTVLNEARMRDTLTLWHLLRQNDELKRKVSSIE